jgi:hypothetical protein
MKSIVSRMKEFIIPLKVNYFVSKLRILFLFSKTISLSFFSIFVNEEIIGKMLDVIEKMIGC